MSWCLCGKNEELILLSSLNIYNSQNNFLTCTELCRSKYRHAAPYAHAQDKPSAEVPPKL